MQSVLVLLLFLVMPNLLFAFPLTPTVPGSYCTSDDPDFDEYRYAEGIAHCRRNVSTNTKNKVCARDGVYDRTNFTVDHCVPLSLGGSNHENNLWCQHRGINSTRREFTAYLNVKNGKWTRDRGVNFVLDFKYSNHPVPRDF